MGTNKIALKKDRMSKSHTKKNVVRVTDTEKELIEQIRDFQQTTTSEKEIVYEPVRTPIWYEEGKSRVLVVGDLHAPFDLPQYLDHCKRVYDEFSCDTVVFIGDVIDAHFSSYHDTDPNGLGGGDELDLAIDHIQRWYEAFPHAVVILGNHDRMAARKAFSGGLPKAWVKDYKDVLNTPNWEYVVEHVIDNVIFIHGEQGQARTKMKSEHQSIVQGHHHSVAYIEWLFSRSDRTFGMQVGTGIDFDAYAFGYARSGKKPAISCAVVLNGTMPFLLPMEL